MSDQPTNSKLPLPQFLKILTGGGVPMAKSMVVAGKIYKEYGTPSQLCSLTDEILKQAGISDTGERRAILLAVRKAGYHPTRPGTTTSKRKVALESEDVKPAQFDQVNKPKRNGAEPGPSSTISATGAGGIFTPSKRRRLSKGDRRPPDNNEFLPDDPSSQDENLGCLDFHEELNEEVLSLKFTVVNRAPVMTAWATVVAEKLGFKRDEALSIASVYTEMNAVSKGISLGLYEKTKQVGLEASKSGSQPYVDLMGRRIPVFRRKDDHWRALSLGTPVSPTTAFNYISASFRQNVPYVIGAMRLLADSYTTEELNTKAWGLYAEFRPSVDQWGERSELSCAKVLSLRMKGPKNVELESNLKQPAIDGKVDPSPSALLDTEPTPSLSLEEYEAALDQDEQFGSIDLSHVP